MMILYALRAVATDVAVVDVVGRSNDVECVYVYDDSDEADTGGGSVDYRKHNYVILLTIDRFRNLFERRQMVMTVT